MKQLILIASLICTTLLSSCELGSSSDMEPGSYADKAAYASINTVTSGGNSESDLKYFSLGDGTTLLLIDDQTTTEYDFEDGQRTVIYYTILSDEENTTGYYGYDYCIRLFSVTKVYTTEDRVVTTQEESDAIADHAMNYMYTGDYIGYGYDHINIVAGIAADDLDNVKVYLVDNQFSDPTEQATGYLNLELRYDRGSDEASSTTASDEYISLDLSSYRDQLTSMNGVIIRVLTLSGEGYYKVDVDLSESSVN